MAQVDPQTWLADHAAKIERERLCESARAEERERCAEIVRHFFNDAGPRELIFAQVLIDRIKSTK